VDTSPTRPTRTAASPPSARTARIAVIPALAAIWSALTIALGLWWWALPDAYPFVPGNADAFGTAFDVVPAAAVPPALVAAGAWGLVVSGPARRRAALVIVTGVGYALLFGLALPGLQPVSLAGYVMAMFGPIVLAAAIVAGAWRRRGGLTAVAVLVLVGAAGWISGIADAGVLARYVGFITASVGKFGPPSALLLLLAGGLLWGVLAVRTALAQRTGRPAPSWTRPESAARWGRTATLIAAACALPYGLQRLTWLTPWPVAMTADELAAHPETRLHGLLLGLAALAGALLTIGLISRWGEVWPRWMPVVRGRPVPVAAAVVPGAIVAALFTAAALPMTLMWFDAGTPWTALVFPFPVWGPALGAAVLAYALRRRTEPALAARGDIEVMADTALFVGRGVAVHEHDPGRLG
jgi:hypothetical protein